MTYAELLDYLKELAAVAPGRMDDAVVIVDNDGREWNCNAIGTLDDDPEQRTVLFT